MKGILKLSFLFSMLVLAVSCKDNAETESNPLFGKWIVDSYSFVNLPSNYTIWEGYELTSLYGETKYTMELEKDTYTRTLTFQLIAGGDTTVTETGEWESDGEYLNLDPTGAGLGSIGVQTDNSFKIVNSEDNDLIVNVEIEQFLYADTATQAYIDYVWDLADSTSANYNDSLFNVLGNKLYKRVIFDLEYDFDVLK